ncbi:MFS multidrug transporter [Ophiocordyceps camponoti-floridani]|uniref:MFS multidrug transporter n=1 Tax=Ophiocordyceps camponoti-floridani TaxID=2030778 RepID=A0A8H4Q6A1_9HYPO|nr:MFS multidrug transporter [Ophiocordyceps camponoti-floridani]
MRGGSGAGKGSGQAVAFPTQQMFVLACCRICEPIAFMSIFPYIYYMIEDFHIARDASQISVYAGMVTSAFTLAEFATGVMWGRLSDKIGRKPVLLTGLLGTALSVLAFGFAPNLPVALGARALGGLLNGNIGVLQTTVAELVTVREQQPRAYTIMPMVWCIGSIIGPIIGGALARPCISYPDLFPRGTIWDRFPYLLPNLFSAAAVLVGVVIGILFLDETHADKKLQRDHGRELGRRLVALFRRATVCKCREKQGLFMVPDSKRGAYGACGSVRDEPLPAYRSRESSPKLSPQSIRAPTKNGPSKTVVFTRPVIMNIVSYGILAFHTMTFDQLFPVFLSTSPLQHPIRELPFKFADGFGLDTKTIGVVMSCQGVYSLLSNFVIVPPVTRRLGSLRLFRMLAFSYFALYLVTPYLVLLPEDVQMPAVYALVIWKCTYATMAYPNNAILLANSAPSKQVLGTINGVAASTASLCRALGPTLSGVLYAVGLKTGYSGLAWWFSGLVTIVGAYLSSRITEAQPAPAEEEVEEALLDDALLYSEDEAV